MFLRTKFFISETSLYTIIAGTYRGADKSLARPGRKQVTATEDYYHNWRNISTVYIYIYIYIYIKQD